VSIEPRATYRVQLHSGFRFDHTVAIVDYLAELGVSHLYSSPCLEAAPGSTHGYDVVNHHSVNRELGGVDGLARLSAALRARELGMVLDIVPNHMAIGPENEWWRDVLENGPSSRYAAYFDVDWDPPEARMRNLVLLPVLGDHYGRLLESGEIKLCRDGGAFSLRYKDRLFPVAPRSLEDLLRKAGERCQSDELVFIAGAHGRLPLSTATDVDSVRRRHRDKEVLKHQLARLCRDQPVVAATVDAVVKETNGDPDSLHPLLERQNYRLAFWRSARRDLGYRRFFDVNSLIGLRVEDQGVFDDTHDLIIRLVADGLVDGLRIDHPDGLRDPEQYLKRVRRACPAAWIVTEKILQPGEKLRQSWPVAGTTGYDFLNLVGGLFIDPSGEEALSRLYSDFTGEPGDYPAIVRQKKGLALRETLGSDVNRLTALFLDVCERHRRHRDYIRHDLQEALREVITCFPVYRTYVNAEARSVDDDDRKYIDEALKAAKAARTDLDRGLFDFLRDLLLLRVRGELESELVMRFQQLTGPAMAKGVEDTAFYCFNRLVALNEVGGCPSDFGVSVNEFHAACIETQSRWPRTMLATSTHDTKRGEDVRVRVALLSEIPERWAPAVWRWAAINEQYRANGMPDRNAEYLFYQTLIGAWPIETARVLLYMEKATREARTHTSWTNPNQPYERALRKFVEATLANREFTTDLEAFVTPLVKPGRLNSLAQTLVKLTAPGIPDIYQGTELWSLTLVDPDNRGPVDYDLRRKLLADLANASIKEIMDREDEGMPKLWTIRQALRLRRRYPELFGPGATYRPLIAKGQGAQHVIAFVRADNVITVAPRMVMRLDGDWRATAIELPKGSWRNQLDGGREWRGKVSLAELLAEFPVALLSRQEIVR
jgi:(1->4)-alpha-D-glucan 1-alpha-D-glucosylmutase